MALGMQRLSIPLPLSLPGYSDNVHTRLDVVTLRRYAPILADVV